MEEVNKLYKLLNELSDALYVYNKSINKDYHTCEYKPSKNFTIDEFIKDLELEVENIRENC